MRKNDMAMLIFAFGLGTLLGVVATASLYGSISNKLSEGDRQQAEEALKKAQDERDDALARIDAYLEEEKQKHLDLEQGAGPDVPGRRAEVATAEPVVEPLPAPREESAVPTAGFGPPRQYGKN